MTQEELDHHRIEQYPEWSLLISQAAKDIADQMMAQTKDRKKEDDYKEQSYLYGILVRTSILMEDVSKLLQNSPMRLTSVFIIFRCVLEDFITVYYFKVNEWDNEIFFSHAAGGFRKHFTWMKDIGYIYDRFFEKTQAGFITVEEAEKGRADFLAHQKYKDFVTDDGKFKEFEETTTDLIKKMTPTRSTRANSTSFLLWKKYSAYIHFTLATMNYEMNEAARYVELKMMREALQYAMKLIKHIELRLESKGFKFMFKTDRRFIDPLFEGTINTDPDDVEKNAGK